MKERFLFKTKHFSLFVSLMFLFSIATVSAIPNPGHPADQIDFTVPINQLLVNNNIGIGTTSPRAELDVHGPDAGSGIFGTMLSRDNGNSWMLWNMDGGYGDDFEIWQYPSTGGSSTQFIQRFEIKDNGDTVIVPSGGNVGIGTTIPRTKLQIDHDGGSTYGMVLRLNQNVIGNGDGPKIEFYKNMAIPKTWSAGILNGFDVGDFVISEDGGYATGFGNPRLTIQTGGYVGIGTPSPQQKLDVNGIVRGQEFEDDDPAYYVDMNVGGRFKGLTVDDPIVGSVSGSAGSVPWSGITGMPAGFADGVDNEGRFTWSGSKILVDGSDVVRSRYADDATNAGNAANADKLIGKNWYWSGQGGQPTWLWGGSDGTNMYVYNPSNFNVNYANSAGSAANADKLIGKNWYWSGQGGQPTWLWGGSDGTNMYVYNPSNFNVNYANSAGSAGNLVCSGCVGTNDIGTLGWIETARWSQDGTGPYIDFTRDGPDFDLRLMTKLDRWQSGIPVYDLRLEHRGGTYGDLRVFGAAYAESHPTFSDARLKENVRPIPNALDRVLQLWGVNFKRINGSAPVEMGFIAQDVEPIFPEVVITDGNGYKSIDYSVLVAALTEAIKEQQKEIGEIMKENKELRNEINLLKQ